MANIFDYKMNDDVVLLKDLEELIDGEYIIIPAGSIGTVLLDPIPGVSTIICEFIKEKDTGVPYDACGHSVFPSEISLIPVKEPIAN
jgi:hypothetical protein